jgi:hypothetical protein
MLKISKYLRDPLLFTTRLWSEVGVHLHIGAKPFLPSHLNDLKACFRSRFGREPEYAFQHSGVPWTTITLIDHLSEKEEIDLIRAIAVMLNSESEVEWDHDFVVRRIKEWFTDSVREKPEL